MLKEYYVKIKLETPIDPVCVFFPKVIIAFNFSGFDKVGAGGGGGIAPSIHEVEHSDIRCYMYSNTHMNSLK